MALEPVLAAQNLCLNYGTFRALDHISFSLQKGECLAVIGANGAGKTSLFDLLSGYQPCSSGEIFLNEQKITRLNMQKRFHAGLFRVDQKSRLFPKMSVLENLECAAFWHHTSQGTRYAFWHSMKKQYPVNKWASEILLKLGMQDDADTLAQNLSYAMQKMLALGMAFASQTLIWLLDEPTAGLNETQTQQAVGLIRSRQPDQSILLIDHDLSVIFALADRLLVLHQGKVLACDTPQAIRSHPQVQEHYLHMADTVDGR